MVPQGGMAITALAPARAASAARRAAPSLLVSATPITVGMRPATARTAICIACTRSANESTVNSLTMTG